MLDRFGRGIKGATVTMTSADGSARTVVTGSNGGYVFEDVPLGGTYTIVGSHRHFSFTPASIEYVHVDQNSEQDFLGTR